MAGRQLLLCNLMAALGMSSALSASTSGRLAMGGEGIPPPKTNLSMTTASRFLTHSIQATLVVCNAFAHSKPLHVYDMQSQQKLTGSWPLGYRECGDFRVSMTDGDQLDFRTSSSGSEDEEPQAVGSSLGVFRAWGLPKSTTSLLLVLHRQGASERVAFQPHAFRDLLSTQLALVDAYHGRLFGRVRIVDVDKSAAPDGQTPGSAVVREEELAFNSVIALNPGNYQLVLSDARGRDVSAADLRVERPRQKFVVLRTGSDEYLQDRAGNRTALRQELLVHEQTPSTEEKSLAFTPVRRPLAVATAAGLAALQALVA